MRYVSAVLLTAPLILFAGLGDSSRLAAAGGAQQKKPANPVAASPESIKEGARTYAVFCRACHGLRARGDGVTAPPGAKPANLTDAEWKHGSTDADIFKNIREGITPFEFMKPQKELSDTELWNLVNYIRSLAQVPKK